MTFERVLSNMLMRTLIFRALAVLGLVWMTATCVVAQDAEAKLKSVFKSYLDDYFRLRPLEATRLGDHRFDSQLEELTPEARAKWLEHTKKTLAALPKEVSYQGLSRPAQIDFEIFEHTLKADHWLAENTRSYQED